MVEGETEEEVGEGAIAAEVGEEEMEVGDGEAVVEAAEVGVVAVAQVPAWLRFQTFDETTLTYLMITIPALEVLLW